MSDTIRALTETVRGRVIIASDPDHDDAPRCLQRHAGPNYERLSAVKAAFDPESLVHVNQNISPAKGR